MFNASDKKVGIGTYQKKRDSTGGVVHKVSLSCGKMDISDRTKYSDTRLSEPKNERGVLSTNIASVRGGPPDKKRVSGLPLFESDKLARTLCDADAVKSVASQ